MSLFKELWNKWTRKPRQRMPGLLDPKWISSDDKLRAVHECLAKGDTEAKLQAILDTATFFRSNASLQNSSQFQKLKDLLFEIRDDPRSPRSVATAAEMALRDIDNTIDWRISTRIRHEEGLD